LPNLNYYAILDRMNIEHINAAPAR
jgi:hypothetical protein